MQPGCLQANISHLSLLNSAEAPVHSKASIGSQWFNRVGILAVLIGMAWFLKFAIDNHWIGPLGACSSG